MRRLAAGATVVSLAAACSLLAAGAASAGTQGPTTGLGSSHGLRYLKAKLESVSTPAGPTVDCPGDRDATGGGGTVSGNPATGFLTSSYANTVPEGWIAAGRSLDSELRAVTAFAICGSKPVSHVDASDSYSDNVFNDGIACANDQHSALSGGIATDGGLTSIAGTYPEAGLSDWIVSFKVEGTTTVTRSVNCSKRYDVTYRSTTVSVMDEAVGAATRFCHGDESVTGGGYQVQRNLLNQFDQWAPATRPKDRRGEAGDGDRTPDDGWLTRIYNGSGHKVRLTTTAICAG